MNEGQRRYAMEQYNLALVRRGLPIDHPIPEQEPVESEYETAHEESDTETLQPESEGETGEIEESQYFSADDEEDAMAPPSIGSQQAGPSGTGKGGKSLKRTKTSDSGVGDDGFGLPGTGRDQGDPGSTGAESRTVALPHPKGGINSYIRYFRKVHKFLTWGISYQIIENKLDNITYRNISTPFAQVPWDRPYFYLNPCEFDSLPKGAGFENMSVTVRARNVRVAFPTNSSATELATLNQNKDIVYAYGLRQNVQCINVQYMTFQDGQPMIPLTWEMDKTSKHEDLAKDMYGRKWAETPQTVPRHQMGIPHPLPTYAMLTYAHDEPESGYICLQNHYQNFDADSVSGSVVLKKSYKPIQGLTKIPLKTIYHPYPTIPKNDFLVVPKQGGTDMYHDQKLKSDVAHQWATLTDEAIGTWTGQNWYPSYIQYIEKAQEFRFGDSGNKPIASQPTLHIGVQPTFALDTKALAGKSNSNFTDTQAYWEVVAECEINTKYPVIYPLYDEPHTNEYGNYWHRASGGDNEFETMYQGLYCYKQKASKE